MEIVWDEVKRSANLAKHGLDFADFEEGFDFDGAVRLPARPSATGRERFRLVGWLNGDLVVVAVVSSLGSQALSLISLRPANAKDRIVHARGS